MNICDDLANKVYTICLQLDLFSVLNMDFFRMTKWLCFYLRSHIFERLAQLSNQ